MACCWHLGCIHSQITGNHIHDVHRQKRFAGAEIAGIKLHAAIDCLIAHNRIERTDRGNWLDWQAQGTRVHANPLLEDELQEFFIEVSHGPTVVDHNIPLSAESVATLPWESASHAIFLPVSIARDADRVVVRIRRLLVKIAVLLILPIVIGDGQATEA